jgi:hypothetical protein
MSSPSDYAVPERAMTDEEALSLAAAVIRDRPVRTVADWEAMREEVRAIAAKAPHPRAVLVNVGQALLWAKPA